MSRRLPRADTEDVMKAWAGLGYYSRARNLKTCADLVAALPGGRFPDTEDGLRDAAGHRRLHGGGDRRDRLRPAGRGGRRQCRAGDVARCSRSTRRCRDAKTEIRALVERLVPADRPGDFAQAMMDLGATICTPRRPRCMLCPLRDDCRGHRRPAIPNVCPCKAPKAEKPLRRGAAFVAVRGDGAILLRKRAGQGPARRHDRGADHRLDRAAATAAPPPTARLSPPTGGAAGSISHVFTHFALELDVFRADVGDIAAPAGHLLVARRRHSRRGAADRHEKGHRSCHTRRDRNAMPDS